MTNYEIMNNTADKLLDIALKHDNLLYYVVGSDMYKMVVRDFSGKEVYSPDLVMSSIYRRYKNNSNDSIDQKVFAIFDQLTKNCVSGPILINTLSNIEYQMRSEKEGHAPFTLDCDKLLENLKNNLMVNRQKITRTIEDINYMDEFKNHNQLLSETYGHKIL